LNERKWNMKREKITVIVPCYNEESALPLFHEEMQKVAMQMAYVDFEYIFVDDGSKDNTMEIIKELKKKDEKIKYISFSRNFGKESAIYAGLKNATGDYVVFMDADLQDPPKLLPEMFTYIKEEGYDSVSTRRVSRKGEPPIRSFCAKCFYKIMNRISEVELMDGARDYRLMTRQYVDALLSLSEYNRFSKGLFGWVGFRTKWIEFENVKRVAGETKWSFWKLFKYSLEGIVSFSIAPLYISSFLGAGMCGVAFVAIIFIVIREMIFKSSAYGWTSMICILIFIGGLVLLSIGVLGFYLSKIYLEVKKRPIYIAKEQCIKDTTNETIEYHEAKSEGK